MADIVAWVERTSYYDFDVVATDEYFFYRVQPAVVDEVYEFAPDIEIFYIQPAVIETFREPWWLADGDLSFRYEQPRVGYPGSDDNYINVFEEYLPNRVMPQFVEAAGAQTLVVAKWQQPAVTEFYGFHETISGTFSGLGNSLRDAVFLTDQYTAPGLAQWEDSLGVQQTLSVRQSDTTIRERARPTERYTARPGARVSDAYRVVETITLGKIGSWADAAPSDEAFEVSKVGTVSLLDRYRLRDQALPRRSAQVLDQGTFQPEQLIASVRRSNEIEEMLGWAETYSRGLSARTTLNETPRSSDSLTTANAGSAQVVDPSFVEDLFLNTESGGWSANTDGWQMTRYEGLPMDASLAVLDGKRYVGSPGGLFRMAREVPVNGARFISVWTDGNTDQLKLPRSLYLGYSSEQPLTVRMWITRGSGDLSYDYQMPAQTADSMLPGRLMLGRGLRARYLRYEVLNPSGEYFYVNSAVIDTDVSTRRI